MRRMVLAYGDRAGATDIFLALRGLRTLELRMRNHHESGAFDHLQKHKLTYSTLEIKLKQYTTEQAKLKSRKFTAPNHLASAR